MGKWDRLMIHVDFGDEIDTENGLSTNAVEVYASGNIDSDMNVIDLTVRDIWAYELDINLALKDLKFHDIERIIETAKQKILAKHEEECENNYGDESDETYDLFIDLDNAEVEKLIPTKHSSSY